MLIPPNRCRLSRLRALGLPQGRTAAGDQENPGVTGCSTATGIVMGSVFAIPISTGMVEGLHSLPSLPWFDVPRSRGPVAEV